VWPLGVVLGAIAGAAAIAPNSLVAAGLATIAAAVVFLRVKARSEVLVATYWWTYVAMSTFLVDSAIDRLFYPFYAVFGLSVLVGLVRGGLRFEARTAWTYGVMLALLIISLIGYQGAVSPAGLKQLTLYVFGVLVMLQVRSPHGSRVIFRAAIIASVAVSVWVLGNAVLGGFSYRGGDVGVDQNVLSFFIGVGFMAVLSTWSHREPGQGRAAKTALLLTALAIMMYALLLLASRGLLLAIAVGTATVFIRDAIQDPARVARLAALAVLLSVAILLPGGRGVLERFDDPGTATFGGRTLIWSVVLSELANSGPRELVMGHGFGAARKLVQGHFTWLGATHNAYLQVLFDVGIVGLTVFLALHVMVFLRAWTSRGRDATHIAGTVVFLLATNLGINTPDSFLYWTTLGWLLGAVQWCSPAGGAGADRPRP